MAERLLNTGEIVAELSKLGCSLTTEQFKSLCMAANTVPHQGTDPHDIEVIEEPGKARQFSQRHIDREYAEDHVAAQRKLHASILRKFQLCYAANRWVDDAETPAKK